MKLIVTNVDRLAQASGDMWAVKYSVDTEGEEGRLGQLMGEHTTFVHYFPVERISILVAEYGLDERDMETVVDIVLAEPFLDPNDGEPTLFSGESLSTIREAHHRRCARIKLSVRLSTRGIQNPIEMIRSTPISGRGVRRFAAPEERR